MIQHYVVWLWQQGWFTLKQEYNKHLQKKKLLLIPTHSQEYIVHSLHIQNKNTVKLKLSKTLYLPPNAKIYFNKSIMGYAKKNCVGSRQNPCGG